MLKIMKKMINISTKQQMHEKTNSVPAIEVTSLSSHNAVMGFIAILSIPYNLLKNAMALLHRNISDHPKCE